MPSPRRLGCRENRFARLGAPHSFVAPMPSPSKTRVVRCTASRFLGRAPRFESRPCHPRRLSAVRESLRSRARPPLGRAHAIASKTRLHGESLRSWIVRSTRLRPRELDAEHIGPVDLGGAVVLIVEDDLRGASELELPAGIWPIARVLVDLVLRADVLELDVAARDLDARACSSRRTRTRASRSRAATSRSRPSARSTRSTSIRAIGLGPRSSSCPLASGRSRVCSSIWYFALTASTSTLPPGDLDARVCVLGASCARDGLLARHRCAWM